MAEEQKKESKPKKKGSFKLIFLMVVIGCLVPLGVPTLLVCLGLFPTLIALLTDTDENRCGLATIGYMNFAGVLPFLIDLWMHGQEMSVALRIIRDPMSWVVMFGAAGIGQLILYAVPPAIANWVISRKEARLETLREGMKELESIWGADVATMAPLEAVRRNKGVQ